ncbi:hypothetical protein M0R45_016321 [Rubus argutus]|uniref:Uncharacterized protein n=1 Tax=Rubus argutus TaxID=59490 RepID=A0AAW1XRK8_RUBAR
MRLCTARRRTRNDSVGERVERVGKSTAAHDGRSSLGEVRRGVAEEARSAVKLLSDKTKETAEDAYAIAALHIVAADKVNDSVLELRESESVTLPLIRAAQGGDEADVSDADADGNSAIHWIVKLSTLFSSDFEPLTGPSVLLLEDPDGVPYQTEMKETPLFFLRRMSVDCAELLLTWGENSEILNLGRQRAIDPTISQDMRYNPTTVRLINHAFPSQHKCTAFELTDEDTTTERNVNSSTKVEVCKYFNSHRGCVRGAKCFYAHCEEESLEVKEGVDQSHSPAAKQFKCKIFVGGLPPSVHSDVLGKFFEEEFGSVEDAMIILNQIQNKIQSRGSGFVTFRKEKALLGSNWKMTLKIFLVISPNLVYLMAGYQKQCHDLYKELVDMVAEASKVVSVTEALGIIVAYVDRFVEDHPDNTRNFGGIIGGWMTSRANMSKLEAVETVMKALLYASHLCDSTGGKLLGI